MPWKWGRKASASTAVLDPEPVQESFYAYANNNEFEALQAFGAILDGFDTRGSNMPKVFVTLPKGWTISEPRGGYEYIYDDKGRERGTKCFAGGNSYLVSMNRWFTLSDALNYDLLKVNTVAVRVANGNGETVYTAESSPRYIGDATDVQRAYGDARDKTDAWLDEHFPDWKSLSAYWD